MNLPGQITIPWNILQLSIGDGPSNVCLRQGQSQTFGRVTIRVEQVGQVQAQRYDGSPIALSRVALSISMTLADKIEEAGAVLMLGLGPALLGAAVVADRTPPAPGVPADKASPDIGHDLANADLRRRPRRRIVNTLSGRRALIGAGAVATTLAVVVAGCTGLASRNDIGGAPTANASTPASSAGVPPASAGPVQVAITFPGVRTPPVPQMVMVDGTSRNLGPGQKIWVFTRNPGDTHLNPQPQAAVLSPDGSWKSQTFIGSAGDAGKSFQILVAVADAAAAAAITGYLASALQTGRYPGLAGLPAGAVQYGQVSVTRQGTQTSPPASAGAAS
jgi:hypothetical protein